MVSGTSKPTFDSWVSFSLLSLPFYRCELETDSRTCLESSYWDVVRCHGPKSWSRQRVLCGGKDGSLNRQLCLHEHMQTPCAHFFMCELGLQSIYILGPLWSWNRMLFVKHLGQSLSTEYSSFLEFRDAEWPQPCGQQHFLLLFPQKGQMAAAWRFFGVSLARRTVISPGAFAVSGDHKWASP